MIETALGASRRWAWVARRAAGLVPAAICVSLSACAVQAPAQDSRSAAAADFERGRLQFERTCAQCHGRNMVNSGVTVYDLRRFPLDQPDRFVQSVTRGKGNMPSFGETLDPEQVRVLWVFVSRRGRPPQ